MGDAANAVTGITGGSVIIHCVYKPETTKESVKSFCKVSGSECTTMTEVKNDLWIPEERFSLTDDKTLGFISVLIRNLTMNDSGTYRCKADSKLIQEKKLDVEEGKNEYSHYFLCHTFTFYIFILRLNITPTQCYTIQGRVVGHQKNRLLI